MLLPSRSQLVEQCRQIYEIYRRSNGVVKSLSETRKKMRQIFLPLLTDVQIEEILAEMWGKHPRTIGLR